MVTKSLIVGRARHFGNEGSANQFTKLSVLSANETTFYDRSRDGC